jgi:hypothetical protein
MREGPDRALLGGLLFKTRMQGGGVALHPAPRLINLVATCCVVVAHLPDDRGQAQHSRSRADDGLTQLEDLLATLPRSV